MTYIIISPVTKYKLKDLPLLSKSCILKDNEKYLPF